MKLHLLLTLIVMVGLWSSCAEEQPTQQTPTAEKASLKTNLEESEGSEETIESTSSDTFDASDANTDVSTERRDHSEEANNEPREIRGSQNFDPNSDSKYYNGDASKGSTTVKGVNTDDIGVQVDPSAGGIPQMTFDEKTYYFGTIEEGDKVTHAFQFVNTGTGDLIITNATATCGCTKPDFSFLPIKPNESSSIEVTFNSAGKDGMQRKAITLTTNAYPKVRKVYLEGKVVPKGTKDKNKMQADPDQK